MKKIYITAPAKTIEKEYIDFAADFLSKNGFNISLAPHVSGKHNYFSGTDAERLSDFQAALDDDTIDAILCARGGYGSVRIIDSLDFRSFRKKPKQIIGFSDITVFHNHIHSQFNIPTVHASVPLNFQSNTPEALESLLNVLNGIPNKYDITSSDYNRFGEVNATIVGGNLSIIYSLIGTNSDLNPNGKILFIEDIGEHIYAIDRILYALKKSEKIQNLAGLIVGGMTNIKDTEIAFGKKAEELIAEIVAPFSYPVCFNFPAGHVDDNRAIVLGAKAKLTVAPDGVTFMQ